VPEAGELKAGRRVKGYAGETCRTKAVEWDNLGRRIGGDDEEPFAGFEDEAEGPHGALDEGEGDLHLDTALDGGGQATEFAVGNVVAGPGVGVVQEPVIESGRLSLHVGRQGFEQFAAGATGVDGEAEAVSDGWPTSNKAAASGVVNPVRRVRNPSTRSMPPPTPWTAKIGMPAPLSASTSRRMVRGETSNCRASCSAVRRPRCCRVSSISTNLPARTS
jgi:hypothetical protein